MKAKSSLTSVRKTHQSYCPRYWLGVGTDNATSIIGCPASGKDVMPCLRKASVGKSTELCPTDRHLSFSFHQGALVSATNRIPKGAFSPVVEAVGGFLPSLPSRLITSGRFSTVEFIGGHCTGDGNTFAGGKPAQFQTEDDIRRIVFSRWPGVVFCCLFLSTFLFSKAWGS